MGNRHMRIEPTGGWPCATHGAGKKRRARIKHDRHVIDLAGVIYCGDCGRRVRSSWKRLGLVIIRQWNHVDWWSSYGGC